MVVECDGFGWGFKVFCFFYDHGFVEEGNESEGDEEDGDHACFRFEDYGAEEECECSEEDAEDNESCGAVFCFEGIRE